MEHPAQVMPIISVRSVDLSRDFYVKKLGFQHLMAVVGNDGKLDFCTVVRDGGRIMFTRIDTPETPKPSADFYFQVESIDNYYAELVNRGLKLTQPENMWWGDRVFIVEDNNGYKLWFYESVSQPDPPVGMKIV